ncbi:ABC transporter ATP-binding protein [Microbacterium capsulatum]|uniref:ABC transporter ATP-binding protein n=1 Tax=Microbacterium capsulatum TaxID=3041921 RepID=A0ABU0XD93_9MICO|nr:ABC transporter ATP-binding protein [Microbacterium sp. ASV81]MDQ4213084.1 ABC transporter ATP-binding protein [Microbacterium sp. ASV81]
MRDLSVIYHVGRDSAPILEHIDLDIQAREMVGVVGESGSGKSTLAKVLLRLQPENDVDVAGEVRLKGEDLLAAAPQRLRKIRGGGIGMVLQDAMVSLNPTLTIGFQLIEGIRAHRDVSRAQAKKIAIELLELVALPDPPRHMKQYPRQLSGGMRQRVALAIGICAEPSVLIADEPTSALDVTVQRQIMELLRSLQRRLGMSVIFITHDLDLASEFCDRVAVLYSGRIVESGTAQEIFNAPLMPYTAGLINCTPRMDSSKEADAHLPSVRGSIADSWAARASCRFAPRCDFAREVCFGGEPLLTLREESGHVARCWGTEPEGWIDEARR